MEITSTHTTVQAPPPVDRKSSFPVFLRLFDFVIMELNYESSFLLLLCESLKSNICVGVRPAERITGYVCDGAAEFCVTPRSESPGLGGSTTLNGSVSGAGLRIQF